MSTEALSIISVESYYVMSQTTQEKGKLVPICLIRLYLKNLVESPNYVNLFSRWIWGKKRSTIWDFVPERIWLPP